LKKILFVAPFPPPVHGAALRNQSVAESERINQQFRMKVFHANQASDVHDIGRFSWRKVLKTIADFKYLIRTLREFQPDLVYFNISLFGFALYRDSLYTLLFKVTGHRLLYHLRTQGVKDQIRRSSFKRLLFRYLFHNVQVICLSRTLFQDIADIYRGEPFIVGNGIPVEKTDNISLHKKQGPTQILFLSNFNIKKGINELLSAFEILKRKAIPFKGVFVGRPFGYTEEDLRNKIEELDMAQYVTIIGPLYGSEKTRVFLESDIFAFPTYFEAFPGVVLEAMQFGLPVVSTFEGAIPEIVQQRKTGLLTEKQNVEQLATALELLISDQSLRERMGKAGKDRFFQYFTLEAFENSMVHVFNQVLNDK